MYAEYMLNKRDSLILVAQNCPEFTEQLTEYGVIQHPPMVDVADHKRQMVCGY
ncbi:hypothetical protein [Comamonas jiangduensis]|uniref:hypothetical protein n=1 Tax=Comamonas jiangduensis TaxID=1194168 RepID=UPI0024E08ECD|nr:hypothetical protein [Comamonas jiangduensis]